MTDDSSRRRESGNWGRILGNALFFWTFGNNIEDVMGPWRFLEHPVACGFVCGLLVIRFFQKPELLAQRRYALAGAGVMP